MAFAVEDAARIAVGVLSVLVFIVGVIAYIRRPTARIFLVLLLFTVFLVEGALLIYEALVHDTTATESLYYLFQLLEIGLVSAIILKR